MPGIGSGTTPLVGLIVKISIASALAVMALGCSLSSAWAAPAVLDTGLVRMGLKDDGSLGGLGVGLSGPTGDAITPGCLCEGWGASAGGLSGWTYGNSGTSNIQSAALTTLLASGMGLSAQSVVVLNNGLQVTQTYSAAAGGKLFRVNVELKNISGVLLSDVRYARTLDWDVSPGYFDDNYTTVYGGTPTGPGGKVLHTSIDPFDVPNPLNFRSTAADTNVTDFRGDFGGYFVFGFGNLGVDESTSFDTYIGADDSSGGLLASLGSVGVEAYSYTTGNAVLANGSFSPAYGYGFVGLGLPPVFETPEPGTLALAAVALLGLGSARRRNKR